MRLKQILIGMIRFYRKYLSGLKGYSTCKYYPTCSQYGIEAIEKYGAIKGRRSCCLEDPSLQSIFKRRI